MNKSTKNITHALIVKKQWLDLILSGEKVWEMRSRPTKMRGTIALIEQGTGLIVGHADLVDCRQPITKVSAKYLHYAHKIDDLTLLEKWCYPWVLKNPKRYKKPIPYDHPQGAVIWVKLQNHAPSPSGT